MNRKRILLCLGGLVCLGILADWASSFSDPVARPGTAAYVVQEGDSLLGIAKACYGAEEYWVEIYRANEKRLPRSGALRPGLVLRLPAVRKIIPTPATRH